MGALFQDVRYAIRRLAKSPGFATVAVLTLALGIGANTGIFTLVNALILRMLPVQDPQALVLFGPGDASGNSDGFPDGDMNLFSYPMYREWQQKNHVFAGVTAFQSFTDSLHGRVESNGNLEPMEVQLVSGTYFNVLGVNPAIGRLFTEADDRILGGHPIAVISYDWWVGRFARDPAIVGKGLNIRGTVYTIIGVTPQGFFGTTVGHEPDLWIPLQMHDLVLDSPHKITDKMYRSLDIIARSKPGATRAQANANMNLLLRNTLHDYAGTKPSAQRLADIQKAHITLHSAATGISCSFGE